MKKTIIKIKKLPIILAAFLFVFMLISLQAQAAPDITVKNITGSGSFMPGQPITFSYDVVNQGDGMDTTNSYRPVKIGETSGLSKLGGAGVFRVFDSVLYSVRAYGAINNRTIALNVWDISVPSDVKETHEELYNTNIGDGRNYNSAIVDGNILYISDYKGDGGEKRDLMIYDINNKLKPVLLGGYSMANQAAESLVLYKKNGRTYIIIAAQQHNTPVIVDVTNPGAPTKVADLNVNFPAGIFHISLYGEYLYVYISRNDLKSIEVYDLSNVSLPKKINSLDHSCLSGQAMFFSVYRSNLFFSCYANQQLYIYDLAQPSIPQLVSTTSNVVGRDFIFSGDYMHGIQGVYNISDPANPKKVSSYSGGLLIENSQKYLYHFYDYGVSSRFATFEPHLFSRVCVNSVGDSEGCLNNASGRIGTDVDAGSLPQSMLKPISLNWTPSLAGNYTAHFCADVKDVNGFDGVAESDETNNCYSVPFTVFSSEPNLKICEDSCNNGGSPKAVSTGSSAEIAMRKGDTKNLRACYNTETSCVDTLSTADITTNPVATWSESGGNSISLSSVPPDRILKAENVGSESISVSYLGKAAVLNVNVICLDDTRCDRDPAGDGICSGVKYNSTTNDNCGNTDFECTGRKNCTRQISDYIETR